MDFCERVNEKVPWIKKAIDKKSVKTPHASCEFGSFWDSMKAACTEMDFRLPGRKETAPYIFW